MHKLSGGHDDRYYTEAETLELVIARLANYNADRITAISYREGLGAAVLIIDGKEYPIVRGPSGGNFTARTLAIDFNPNTNKRCVKLDWYADGKIYSNYIDFTN